jgi:hypothetical protein
MSASSSTGFGVRVEEAAVRPARVPMPPKSKSVLPRRLELRDRFDPWGYPVNPRWSCRLTRMSAHIDPMGVYARGAASLASVFFKSPWYSSVSLLSRLNSSSGVSPKRAAKTRAKGNAR